LPGGTGFTFFQDNTLSSAEENANLRITANGTGTIELLKSTALTGDLTINAEGDLRLADASGGEYVALQAPSTVTTYTITLPSAAPSRNGFVLRGNTDGTTSWGAGNLSYSIQTSSFTAETFSAYFVNTNGGAVSATLPSSPTLGDTIRFYDLARTFDNNTFTVQRNGQPIMGDSADLSVTTEGAAFELVYSDSTYGWRIFSV
jgi:hypothetical protein